MYSNNRTTTNERIFNFNADLKLLTNPTNSDSIDEDNWVFSFFPFYNEKYHHHHQESTKER